MKAKNEIDVVFQLFMIDLSIHFRIPTIQQGPLSLSTIRESEVIIIQALHKCVEFIWKASFNILNSIKTSTN